MEGYDTNLLSDIIISWSLKLSEVDILSIHAIDEDKGKNKITVLAKEFYQYITKHSPNLEKAPDYFSFYLGKKAEELVNSNLGVHTHTQRENSYPFIQLLNTIIGNLLAKIGDGNGHNEAIERVRRALSRIYASYARKNVIIYLSNPYQVDGAASICIHSLFWQEQLPVLRRSYNDGLIEQMLFFVYEGENKWSMKRTEQLLYLPFSRRLDRESKEIITATSFDSLSSNYFSMKGKETIKQEKLVTIGYLLHIIRSWKKRTLLF